MKKIEKINPNERFNYIIWNMLYKSWQASFFETAIKNNTFELLVEPKTAREFAEEKGYNSISTVPYLDVLTSMGLLDKSKGKYVNKPETSRYLNSSSNLSQGESYMSAYAMGKPILQNLEEVLKGGGNKFKEILTESMSGDDKMWAKMARSMEGSGLYGAQELLPHIKALPEWNSFKKMMDMGGGPGSYCMVFVSEHPHMKGVVFDQKGVVSESAKIINEYGLQDRISTQGGNYITDAKLGEDYDFIWSCATLNFAKGCLADVFCKVYDALNPGGVFVSYHPSVSESGIESPEMVVSMAIYAMLGMDMQFYGDEISNAMIDAGFKTVQSKDIITCYGRQRLDIARKAK